MSRSERDNAQTDAVTMPEFDEMADLFWRLGVMQSPSQLQGFLAGQLALANAPSITEWLSQAQVYLDCVEATNSDEDRLLVQLYSATCGQFDGGNMDFALLLPDDACEITQRVDCLSQWCKGFLSGFAMAGKDIQKSKGQRQYSKDVAESLSDMGAISQIGLTDEDVDEQQRERDYFEVSEYLRLAAINIYLECGVAEASSPDKAGSDNSESSPLATPAGLFGGGNNKLH